MTGKMHNIFGDTWWDMPSEYRRSRVPLSLYIRENLDPRYQKRDAWLDWNILGDKARALFDNVGVPRKLPKGMYVDIWYNYRNQVIELLKWLQSNVFDKLHINNKTTDHILLKIAKNKLDKIGLPEKLSGDMHTQIFACYHARRAVMDDYELKVVQGLPF